jgi:hypothetical protein
MFKKIAIIGVSAALVFGLAACSESTPSTSAQKEGQAVTEQAFDQQSKAVPYPVAELKDSLERQNLRDRLLRTNKPEAIGYVYLMNFGQIVGYYTVKGKVSSTNSQMTTDQLIIKDCNNNGNGCYSSVVNAPGDDGSYGPNEQGIFFFTTEGAMVTTSLDYIWADNQIAIDVPRLG